MIEIEEEQILKVEYVLAQLGNKPRDLTTFDPDDPRNRMTYFTYQDGTPYSGATNKDFTTGIYYTGVNYDTGSLKLIQLKKPVKLDPNDVKKLPTLDSEMRTYENTFVGVDDFTFLQNLTPGDKVNRPLEQLALIASRAMPMSTTPRGFVQQGLAMFDPTYVAPQSVSVRQDVPPPSALVAPTVSAPVLQATENDMLMNKGALRKANIPPEQIGAYMDDLLNRYDALTNEATTIRDHFDKNTDIEWARTSKFITDFYNEAAVAFDVRDEDKSVSELLRIVPEYERIWGRMKPLLENAITSLGIDPPMATVSNSADAPPPAVAVSNLANAPPPAVAVGESSANRREEVLRGVIIPPELERYPTKYKNRYVDLVKSNLMYNVAELIKFAKLEFPGRSNEAQMTFLENNKAYIAQIIQQYDAMDRVDMKFPLSGYISLFMRVSKNNAVRYLEMYPV